MSIGAVLTLVAGFIVPFAGQNAAEAATGTDFDPGYIISDQRFYDSSAMSTESVQQFLNTKRSGCSAGYVCLKDYRQTTWTRDADAMCARYTGMPNESAAQIIARVAGVCGINPQVILVLLEKEQSLVTSASPSATRYQRATGFACPDIAPCDAEFSGFYNQVYKAAWQLKRYTNPSGTSKVFTWFGVGKTSNVRFHPNAACGTSPVNIKNQATASLYYYTPYQPNTAALNNMYGVGNSCSAYGNRNFWRLFSDWFGSPTGPVAPFGSLEEARGMAGGVQLSGWAIDPDSLTGPIDVHVYIGGLSVAREASLSRPDVAAGYPAYGSNRGYSTFIGTPPGTYQACVWAINEGPGTNTSLGCRTVTVPTGAPIGELESATVAEGQLTLRGWALDPDATATLPVHVYVDSAGWEIKANVVRADIGSRFPWFGPDRGFAVTLPVLPGAHRVCAYGINLGPGSNAPLGCRDITVPAGQGDRGTAPTGNFEAASAAGTKIRVSGWSLDPDTAASIPVHVYVNGKGTAIIANQARTDVGRAYAGYGDAHGFSTELAGQPGANTVCVYGINTGRGVHTPLGCRTVQLASTTPHGNLEAVTTAGGSLKVEGWALSKAVSGPIPVHVYVDGIGTAITADRPRPDVASVFPEQGPDHGFSVSIPAASGSHQVCAWGIDTVGLRHLMLGCRTVRN